MIKLAPKFFLILCIWASVNFPLSYAAQEQADSPVVATVNDQVITLREIDESVASALQSTQDPAVQVQIRAQALNALINQMLIEQLIAKTDLKNNPAFAARVNEIRKKAQVTAYIESRLGKLPTVNEQYVDQFYRANPEIFAKRRVFHYSLLFFPVTEKMDLAQTEKVLNNVGPDGLRELIKKQGIEWGNVTNWLGVDQMNPAIYAALKVLGDGQSHAQLSPDKKSILVYTNIASYSDPISIEVARPAITSQLEKDIANEASRRIVAELRQKSSIKINDEALKKQSELEILPDKGLKPATLLDQFKITWLFAMFILVPFSLIAFYRMGIPAVQADDIARPSLFEAIKKILSPRVNYSIQDLHIPKGSGQEEGEKEPVEDDDIPNVTLSPIFRALFVLIMGVWLLQPSVQFFGAIPNWLSLQKLILLAFGGIGAGIALSLVCWKGPYIQKLFGNRWVGIGLVLIVHRILLLV